MVGVECGFDDVVFGVVGFVFVVFDVDVCCEFQFV